MAVSGFVSTTSCFVSVVAELLVVQEIHNKNTTNWKLCNKSATSWTSGIWDQVGDIELMKLLVGLGDRLWVVTRRSDGAHLLQRQLCAGRFCRWSTLLVIDAQPGRLPCHLWHLDAWWSKGRHYWLPSLISINISRRCLFLPQPLISSVRRLLGRPLVQITPTKYQYFCFCWVLDFQLMACLHVA